MWNRICLAACFLAPSHAFFAQVGKVGINTTSPAAMLHVMDSSVLFSGPVTLPGMPGAPPVSGPGNRMMWYADKASFRAGSVNGTQWDKDSIGLYSAAFGQSVKARGIESFVGGGLNNVARGSRCFVGGGNNNTSSASNAFVGGGEGNTASGGQTFIGGGVSNVASATNAFAGGGSSNQVSGSGAFVGGGRDHVASAIYAFVGGGENNNASGGGAFIGGGESNLASNFRAFVGGGMSNSATQSDAFVGGGNGNTASQARSFVGGGEDNTASGADAFVGGGVQSTASGEFSFVGGGGLHVASGQASFTGGGLGLLAKSFGEAVFGTYNTDYTPNSTTAINANDRLFVVGNGTGSATRSNAVTVLKNGRVGIGTDTPDLLLELRGPESAIDGPTVALGGSVADQLEAGRIRFLDGTASNNWRGIYMHHDGSTNEFHIGVHNDNTNTTADDIPVITIERGTNPEVGIGTTNPTAMLEVNAEVVKKISGGSWTASSDRRLKQDIVDYTEGLREVMAIRPVTFRYNALSGYDTASEHIGVIAQELQPVAPHMVSEFEQNGSSYLQVDNSAMTYMLINAVKEQQAIIEDLQNALQQEKMDKAQLASEVRQLSEALADIKAMLTARPAMATTAAQVAE